MAHTTQGKQEQQFTRDDMARISASAINTVLEQLNIATRLPSLINYGYLRLHPFWDPLRGDPRFEKLVAEAAAPIPLK